MRKKGNFLWLNWRFSLTYLANQTQNLSAILQNFSTAIEATETAYNSAGSAAEENSRVMESLGARLTAVQSSFQELANNVISSDLVGAILDLTNSFLELLNSGIGPTIVQFALLTGVLTGGISLFGQIGSGLGGSVKAFVGLITTLKTAYTSAFTAATALGATGAAASAAGASAAAASVGFSALWKAALPIAGIIAGIAVAGVGLYSLWKDANPTLEELRENLEQTNEELNEFSASDGEYAQLLHVSGQLTEQEKERLAVIEAQRDALLEQGEIEAANELTGEGSEYQELLAIAEETGELTEWEQRRLNYLELQYQELKKQNEEAQRQYIEQFQEERGKVNRETVSTGTNDGGFYFVETTKAQEDLEDLKDSVQEVTAEYNAGSLSMEEYVEKLESILSESEPLVEQLNEMGNLYDENGEKIQVLSEEDEEYLRIIDDLFKAVSQYYDLVENEPKPEVDLTPYEEYQKVLEENAEMFGDWSIGLNNASDELDAIQKALSTAKAAHDEYNASGAYSIDTLQSLLTLEPQYLAALINEQGQLVINNNTLNTLMSTANERLKQMAAQQIAGYAEIVMEEELANQMGVTDTALANSSGNLAANSQSLMQNAAAAFLASEGQYNLHRTIQGQGIAYGLTGEYLERATSRIMNYASSISSMINSAGNSIQAYTGTLASASSAASSVGQSSQDAAEAASEAWKEAFDQQVAELEHSLAMDYITEEEYYNQLMTLVEKYLAGRKEYLDEYRQYEEEFYEWQKEQAEAVAEAQKQAFDDYISYREHLLNMNVISEEQYYAELEEQIRNYWAIGVLSAEEYRDYLEQLYDWQLSQLEDAADAMKEAYDDLVSETEDQFDAVMDYVSDYADEQIAALEKEYDALQDQIDAVNDKYDEQIDKLEAENEELDKQIQRQQLLDALAEAREKRLYVYKEGEGFTYMQDIDAIAEAQEALDEFDREQMIEDEKDLIEQNRENELKYLEDEQAALEAEIERWEQYKEGWADIVDNYQKTQNELIAQQILGTKLEGTNWDNRLNLLENFTNMYNQFQDELLANQESVTQTEQWNWNERLQNLRDFYEQYLAILDQINDLETPLQPGEATDDYWYGDIGADYAALMQQSKSIQEFQYWAQQRLHKIQAAGIDLEEKGWATNEEIYQKWLQSMGGIAPSDPNWQAPTTGGEDYHPLYGTQQNPNVSNGVSYDPDVDYAAKMLGASSRDEFNYWAERRIAKALGEGIDIFSGEGWATNEDLLQKWLQNKGYNILASSANTMSLLSGPGYDASQTAARNLVSTAGYGGGNNTTSYSFAIDNLSLPNATDANSLVSGLRNMAQQYSTQRSYSY